MKITKMKTLWLQNAPETCLVHLYMERERVACNNDMLGDPVHTQWGWKDSGNKECPKPHTLTPREALRIIVDSRRSPADFYVMEALVGN